MKNNSTKKIYIKSLLQSISLVKELNGSPETEEYLTFFTSYGTIIGKVHNKEPYLTSDLDDLGIEMERCITEGAKPVNVINISRILYNNTISQECIDETNDIVILKDVTIYNNVLGSFKTDTLGIFSDQIIGVVPGKAFLDEEGRVR